jgi:hypothetical protein
VCLALSLLVYYVLFSFNFSFILSLIQAVFLFSYSLPLLFFSLSIPPRINHSIKTVKKAAESLIKKRIKNPDVQGEKKNWIVQEEKSWKL